MQIMVIIVILQNLNIDIKGKTNKRIAPRLIQEYIDDIAGELNRIFSFPTIKYVTHLSLSLRKIQDPVKYPRQSSTGGTVSQTFDLVLVCLGLSTFT